jgi:RND family efflux transporter MFP subunit
MLAKITYLERLAMRARISVLSRNIAPNHLRSFAPLGSAACLLLFGLMGCDAKPATPTQTLPPTPVKTEVARQVPIPVTSQYLVSLKSRESAAINPQVEGWVVKIDVRSGERVHEGQPILEIDPRVQQATLNNQVEARAAQQATVANAEAQFNRAQDLFKSGIISKQDYDTAKATYDNAAAQLHALDAGVNQQQVQLHYYTVSAPTNGIVGDIPVHVGDRVTNTTLLTTVDAPGSLEAYIYVPVEHAQDLRQGEAVDLLDDAGKIIAHSSIFFVSPQIDTGTQTVLAKALIANPGNKFRTDEFVNARITWRTDEDLVIPVLAVTRINGQFFAFLAAQGSAGTVAHQQQIQLGDILGNNYVVVGGINAGDHIITGGFQFLVDGAPVKETVEEASSPSASS